MRKTCPKSIPRSLQGSLLFANYVSVALGGTQPKAHAQETRAHHTNPFIHDLKRDCTYNTGKPLGKDLRWRSTKREIWGRWLPNWSFLLWILGVLKESGQQIYSKMLLTFDNIQGLTVYFEFDDYSWMSSQTIATIKAMFACTPNSWSPNSTQMLSRTCS